MEKKGTRGRKGSTPMKERTALVAALIEAVSTRQAHEFGWLVKAAYGAGASRQDLVLAVETGRYLGNLPEPIAVLAYAAVQAWQWMASRREVCGQESAPRVSGDTANERKAGSHVL